MSRAIGGYMRRCERYGDRTIDPIRVRHHIDRFPMAYQSMPVLRFEQFDVEPVDKDDTPTIASIHERYQGNRTY